MMDDEEAQPQSVPWRDNSSFVLTYYSILAAMVGAILALAISDPQIEDSWYLPVTLLALSMFCFIWGLEKCGEAMNEDDVDKYLTWLLICTLGTVAMFFGISTYIVLHYRPGWAIFFAIQILVVIASSKWLHDIWSSLFQGEAEYQAHREEMLGTRQPEKHPDALMHLVSFLRRLQAKKAKG
jgi:uncharacterized protein (DUF983 family)